MAVDDQQSSQRVEISSTRSGATGQPRSAITGQFGPKFESEGHMQLLGQLISQPDEVLDRLLDDMISSHLKAVLPGLVPLLKGILGSDAHGKIQRGLQQVGGSNLPVD